MTRDLNMSPVMFWGSLGVFGKAWECLEANVELLGSLRSSLGASEEVPGGPWVCPGVPEGSLGALLGGKGVAQGGPSRLWEVPWERYLMSCKTWKNR